MLRELRIRNFAVIESVAVEFRPGLNVLTGETGAGKSMLIDAILLVLGGRAQTDVIRSDADAATLEAVFDVEPRGAVVAALDEAGLALDDGLLVARRELGRSGRHRAFVNDAAVTVGLLERLGDHLVEVHGQHEHQRLLEPARQLELLDRFADTEELRERVAGLVATFRAARAEAERMRAAERDRAQREDLLRFQLSELDGARLRPGEEEELRQERRRRQHADKLTAGLADVAALLDDDRDVGEPRSELVGVLTPPPLLPEFLLLARAQTRAVELGELEAQEILALGAVALGGAHPLRLGARGAERRHEARHALPELLRVGEAVQELELAGGLKQTLVLVLAMHLDEVVAEAFEEPDGDSRVVDEGAVAARATELPPRHQETVVEREPRLVERRDDGAARLDVEDRLKRRGVGVASDHVSLGAPAED